MYNPYNFTNITFNESAAQSVIIQNAELIIVLLLIITVCQVSSLMISIFAYYSKRL